MYRKLIIGVVLFILFLGGCETVTSPENGESNSISLKSITDPTGHFYLSLPSTCEIQNNYLISADNYLYLRYSDGKNMVKLVLLDLKDMQGLPSNFYSWSFNTQEAFNMLFHFVTIEDIEGPTPLKDGFYYTGTINDPEIKGKTKFIYYVTGVAPYQVGAIGAVLNDEITKDIFLYEMVEAFTVIKTL